MDEDEFITFLTARGYSAADARALVDQVLDGNLAPDGFLDVTCGDGHVVQVEVDDSMGFAGVVRFNVPGQPAQAPGGQAT